MKLNTINYVQPDYDNYYIIHYLLDLNEKINIIINEKSKELKKMNAL